MNIDTKMDSNIKKVQKFIVKKRVKLKNKK